MSKPLRWLKWLFQFIFGVKKTMINLPNALDNFMKGKDLAGLKPFAFLYRNKWDSVNNTYAIDTTPIDISDLIVKPNTLSMTLDVNEIAQYNANNVTLTLSDTQNRFIEGTPNSYFPDGYQLYGSRVVLYYGLDSTNRTALFTGVIKDLPTYKPEKYQVDLKLVSPLELLKDIEAKEFSNKVTGETLTFVETDSDGHKIYQTTGTGVGGFDAVYADGNKLFDGVDYEVEQLNALGLPAIVTIINSDYYSATITADYYKWKTGLSVEQIVAGLVALAGYNSGTEDIRNVVWNTSVRNAIYPNVIMGLGYYQSGSSYDFNWFTTRDGLWQNTTATNNSRMPRKHIMPENFETEFKIRLDFHSGSWTGTHAFYQIGTNNNNNDHLNDSIRFYLYKRNNGAFHLGLDAVTGGQTSSDIWSGEVSNVTYLETQTIKVRKIGATWTFFVNGENVGWLNKNITVDYDFLFASNQLVWSTLNQVWRMLDSNGNQIGPDMLRPGILTNTLDKTSSATAVWGEVVSSISGDGSGGVVAYFSSDGTTFDAGTSFDLGAVIGRTERYMRFILQVVSAPDAGFDITSNIVYYLDTSVTLGFVNLTGLTVLEALQDFALISGYEFGVDRNGVFFFRPRVSSTTPTYNLDHEEIAKVDTIKKNLSDFFTKLTLTFAQVPLEFYANSGPRPTLVDKYGVINKEIDKPDIVNYDNPELAQAIGPQLLEVYSSLPSIIQATGKLNLAIELGDIVNLKRNYPLIEPNSASDYTKFENQQTYYRACKVIGMNYNFAKRQITYTLRDVSNYNNSPIEGAYMWEFVYDLPIQLGAK